MAHTGKIEYKDELGFRDLGPIVKSGGASPIEITCGLRMMNKSEVADAVSTIKLANILGRTKEGENLLAGAYNRMGKSIASGKLDKSFYEAQGHVLGVFDALFKALKQTSLEDHEAKDKPVEKKEPESTPEGNPEPEPKGDENAPEKTKSAPSKPSQDKKNGPWSEENQKRVRAMGDDEFDKYSMSVGKDYGIDMDSPQKKKALQYDLDPQRTKDKYYDEHIRPARELRDKQEQEQYDLRNQGYPDTADYGEIVEDDEDDGYSPPYNIIDDARRNTTVNLLDPSNTKSKAALIALVNRMLLEQREAEFARQQSLNLRDNRGARSRMDPLANEPYDVKHNEKPGTNLSDLPDFRQIGLLDERRMNAGLPPMFNRSSYGVDTQEWMDAARLDPETAAKMVRDYGQYSDVYPELYFNS